MLHGLIDRRDQTVAVGRIVVFFICIEHLRAVVALCRDDLAGRALVCQPQITSFLFLEGKAFHLLVDYLPVNRVFQIDNIHNRIMLCSVLFFCKT